MKRYDLQIKGLTCASCVARVEKIISKHEHIKNVNVNLATERVTFECYEDKIDLNKIATELKDYGYELKVPQLQNKEENYRDDYYSSLKNEFILALVLTIPVFIISMLTEYQFFYKIIPLTSAQVNKILLILTTPIILVAGKRFFKAFWTNLKHLTADMNSLVTIGTSSAYIYSIMSVLFPEIFTNNKHHVYFDTTAVIITLILMGKLLEHKAKRKTTDTIKKLIELQPKTARIIKNGEEVEIQIEELKTGDIVVIKPGEKIPADGIIVWGTSTVDESMITGESMPIDKTVNSKVIGGTVNIDGTFNFRVTQIGDNSILGKIIKLVQEAQASKPPIQRLVDKIATIFVPAIIIIAIITFFGWLIFSPEHSLSNSLINFIAVLIVACPCALGLATPTAIIVGIGKGASYGILIKNSEALEAAYKLSTIIFDKTGTITEGKPELKVIYTNGINENELLFYAASVESKSEHPLAKAIINKAKSDNVNYIEPDSVKNFSGAGIAGTVNNKQILVGSINLLKEHSVETNNLIDKYYELVEKGKTLVCVAIESKLKGLLVIEDRIREDSIKTIKKLNEMKIHTVLLTGDNKKVAKLIADTVGIKEYKAEVLPEDKANVVKDFQKNNNIVGMVGDGINDAPALAQSDLGIAIGTGTDIAIETADIVLVNGNLNSLIKIIHLSRKTITTIKQNLFWAFIYNIILIPLAAFGLLNPMLAALSMSFSSVSVITNSLRLKKASI
ncbi:MAG: heavy metal translocating P-type ATPase [Melioribacter sp.]|nr:heavy metal translocating P-type ATPase [Melioribacter sp.]